MNLKRMQSEATWGTVLILMLYVIVALARFVLVHPWMTRAEVVVYSLRVITWGSVDYQEARPREGK